MREALIDLTEGDTGVAPALIDDLQQEAVMLAGLIGGATARSAGWASKNLRFDSYVESRSRGRTP